MSVKGIVNGRHYQSNTTLHSRRRDTDGRDCRVERTGNANLVVDGDTVAHRLVQLILVGLYISFASGNQVNHSKGKRLPQNKSSVENNTRRTMLEAYIDCGFKTPEDSCNGRSKCKLREDGMFADDGGQKRLMD